MKRGVESNMSENTSLVIRDIEKKELNHTVTSYVEKKNELQERVPELIDWDMFRRRISPELVDVLQMQHKRLKKQELSIKTQEKEMAGGLDKGKVYFLQHGSQNTEGSCSIGILRKKRKRLREYYRGNQLLSKFRDRGRITYFVKKEPEETHQLFLEDKTVRLQELYVRDQDYRLELKKSPSVLPLCLAIIPLWMGIGVFSYALYFFASVWLLTTFNFPYWSLDMVLMGTWGSAVGINVLGKALLIYLMVCRMRRVKSYKVLQSIRQQWPDFCMEKFIAMVSNRLKCIFYADTMEEIGNYVSCDLTNALVDYANVVDCEILDFRFKGISRDENYQYIDVQQKVLLTKDLGKRIKREKKKVKLRLVRPVEGIMSMDVYQDWYINEVEVKPACKLQK